MTDPGPSPRDAAVRAGVTLRLLWPQRQILDGVPLISGTATTR